MNFNHESIAIYYLNEFNYESIAIYYLSDSNNEVIAMYRVLCNIMLAELKRELWQPPDPGMDTSWWPMGLTCCSMGGRWHQVKGEREIWREVGGC